MNIKCRETRKNRKLQPLKLKLDSIRIKEIKHKCVYCNSRIDGIVNVPIWYLEQTINNYIKYLEKDKSRFKDLDKAKFDFLKYMVNKKD